jgi:hypothetical protein
MLRPLGSVGRTIAMLAAMFGLAPFASAYYYWIYYAGRTAPFVPVPIKFDLNPSDQYGLQNNTAVYVISAAGPSAMMPGDSFPAIVNEIRSAANVWNGVNTSAVKLQFGGLSTMTTPEASAGVDVVFTDDIPPGLLAYTAVTTVADPNDYLANGATSLPLVHSTVHLASDLTVQQQSSYSDSFFVTLVHEFGHSLGLQHTETSSVMSTAITSASTKAVPLAADDIAGVSLLYPANGYPTGTGSVSGAVTLGGNGVNMASVVALSLNGTAVSALTNPDGTFTINGIAPGQYYVYAHPLPPPATGEAYPDNIYPPVDPSGNPFLANTSFGTQFFGGTTDWTQAQQVTVSAGNVAAGVNFNVPSRPAGPAVSGMTVFSYPPGNGQVAVSPAPLENYGYLAFAANGIVVNGNQVAPGLNVSVMGGAAYPVPSTMKYFATVQEPVGPPRQFVLLEMVPNPVPAPTPVALAVSLNNDVYVLPSAFRVVTSGPPSISAVSGTTDGQGNSVVRITGSNLGTNTRILFDSFPALSTTVNGDGSLTAVAPPAANGYQASVEAVSPDSQTSWELLSAATIPTRFTFGGPSLPSISVNLPGGAPGVAAGTDSMVMVSGFNTNFTTGQVAVGFGSSDIVVKGVWVVNPGLLYVDVSVNANAAAQNATVTVANGLELITLSGGLQITAANAGQATLRAPILNQATGLAGVPAGGTAVINTSGLPANLSGYVLMISNQQTTYTVGQNNQLLASVPAGSLAGPAIVRLFTPAGISLPPVVMQIDIPAPAIAQAANSAGVIGNMDPVSAGETVSLSVAGLADQTGALPPASNVEVNVGGVVTSALGITASGQGLSVVQFTLPSGIPSGPQTVTVQVGTRLSAPYTILVQ